MGNTFGRRDVVAEHVDVAGLEHEQGRLRVVRQLELEAVEPHVRGVAVVGVAGQGDRLAWNPLLEHEGAGPQRMAPELLYRPILGPLTRHHIAELHERLGEGQVGLLEVDLDGVLVEDLVAGDVGALPF